MDEDDASGTRVFVSELPPNFTSEQLGAHFARKCQTTDAVVVPGRRIGFVGFKNHTQAKNAARYFNKTYVRMSKISVEIARPVELNRSNLPHNAGKAHSGLASTNGAAVPLFGNTKAPSSRKRKYQDGTAVLEDRPPTEDPSSSVKQNLAQNGLELDRSWFSGLKRDKNSRKVDAESEEQLEKTVQVELGKVAKKKRRISNANVDQAEVTSGVVTVGSNVEGRPQDEKHRQRAQVNPETINQKTEEKADKKLQKEAQKQKDASEGISNADGRVEIFNNHACGISESSADAAQSESKTTEADWLRGKTSRLLDILDPDETLKHRNAQETDRGTGEAESAELKTNADTPTSGPTAISGAAGTALRVPNGRLLVRNLPYSTTEEDLRRLFSEYGKITEVHISKDHKSATSKGLAYVQFVESQSAEQALRTLDTTSYQGRLLHVLPASNKKSSKLDEFEISKLPLKKQKALKRRAEAANHTFSWNSMYMNPDAVLSSVAERLGVAKSQVLDPTSADAAVKQAHAETSIIQETKSYLKSYGVNTEAFKNKARDRASLLLKNFVFGTSHDDLKVLLEPFGVLRKLIIPPSGTIAIAQFEDGHSVDQAFKHLAYRNVKGSVLFLEKGPEGLFDVANERLTNKSYFRDNVISSKEGNTDTQAGNHPISTLFVRNLNFATTNHRLQEVFRPLQGFLSARIKTRTEPKRPGEVLSMGFGFVEFRSKGEADAAVAAMDGYKLDNHELLVKASHRSTDVAEERRLQDLATRSEANKTKIIIKNLPFEATKKDIRSLFGAYGQLRTVRVPKKFDNSTRGFAFADFLTAKEAENAMEALSNTHLLGRRIILEFAAGEAVNPEEEIAALEKKVDRQNERVNRNKLTGSARRKFNVDAGDGNY